MIGWFIAGILAVYVWQKSLEPKSGLTRINPQPVIPTPQQGSVGPVVGAVQPQIEMGKVATITRNIPYSPTTIIVPDIGAGVGEMGIRRTAAWSLVPSPAAGFSPDVVGNSFQQGVVPNNENQISSQTLDLGISMVG